MIPPWVAVALTATGLIVGWFGKGFSRYVDIAVDIKGLTDAKERMDKDIEHLRDQLDKASNELAEQRGAARHKSNSLEK